MAPPQTPEEERADIENLKALVDAEDAGLGDLDAVYCVPEGDDPWERDNVLGRFARARRGDARAALALLQKDYAWRLEHDVPGLRTQSAAQVLGCDYNAPRTLSKYYQRRVLGVDAAGRLCLFQSYKTFLAKELKHHIPLATVLRFHVWEQERAAAVADELERIKRAEGGGPASPKFAVLLDVAEMTISKHVTKDFMQTGPRGSFWRTSPARVGPFFRRYVVKELSRIDQDHFPERMGVTFILNAPGVFGLVWRVVKPWLDVTPAAPNSLLGVRRRRGRRR